MSSKNTSPKDTKDTTAAQAPAPAAPAEPDTTPPSAPAAEVQKPPAEKPKPAQRQRPPAKPKGPLEVVALTDGYAGTPVAFRKKGERFRIASEADLGRWMQRVDQAGSTESPSSAAVPPPAATEPEGNTPTGDQSVI